MPAKQNPQTTLAAADRCNFLVDSAVDGSATKIRLLAKATRSAAVLNMAPRIARAPYATSDSTLSSHDLMCSRCDCLQGPCRGWSALTGIQSSAISFDLTTSLTFCCTAAIAAAAKQLAGAVLAAERNKIQTCPSP